MTTQAYLAVLEKLGLTPASRATARALGVSVRHAMKYAHGDAPVPRPIVLLLAMYLRHGLPDLTDGG